ncbi:MAG: hypothetical protein ACHQ2F_08270 [Desulfobaccales bacterium]
MKFYGYGEDALTLWALKMKLSEILEPFGDYSPASDCKIFFRPSFGRRGGKNSSQFGEFDFLILARECLYLGESKWDQSSELINDTLIDLRPEQLLRHDLFKFYIHEWAFGQYSEWGEFVQAASPRALEHFQKPLAYNSLLEKNLKTVMDIIRSHFHQHEPQIHNVLLYLYGSSEEKPPAKEVKDRHDFKVVQIRYMSDQGNYISIEI